VFACTSCGDTVFVHQSCKHRFCAQCGAADTIKWANQMLSRLIDFKHFHVVTTLPKPLRVFAKMNDNLIFNLLFSTSADIIKSWFKAKHNLRPGIVSVLHTSGSDLKFHPHVHMIVSGGGQHFESGEYLKLKSQFLCAQQFLGDQLKIKFQAKLIKLFEKGKIKTPRSISDKKSMINWLLNINQKHWIVAIQKPLDDIHQIIGYVGRYTKRACISEYKITDVGQTINFQFNDYKNSPRGEKPKQAIKVLKPIEFLDQLLQHVPSKRYRMVRYYGLYNSLYLNKIPNQLKATFEEKELSQNDDFEWGEFEQFRKSLIRAGRPDPLFCYTCKQNLAFIGILFNDKMINTFQYDSS